MRFWQIAGIGLTFAGCALRPYEIPISHLDGTVLRYPSKDQKATIDQINHLLNPFFSEPVKPCLATVVDMLMVDKNGASSHNHDGIYLNGEPGITGIHTDHLNLSRALAIKFHKNIHRLEQCGLLDRVVFAILYHSLDEKLPIKQKIEEILKRKPYDSGKYDLLSERMAYAAHLWVWSNIEMPDELVRFYKPVLELPFVQAVRRDLMPKEPAKYNPDAR